MAVLPFVYLTSPPFSGSTLFALLASTHPQIATVGEMTGLIESKDPENYDCSCGKRIRYCRFWNEVAARMVDKGFEFDPSRFDTKLKLDSGRLSQRLFNASMPNVALGDLRDRLIMSWPQNRRRIAYLVARNKALANAVLQVTRRTVFFDASKGPGIIRFLSRDPDIDFRVVHLVRDVRGTSFSRRKNKGETDWPRIVNKWVHANRIIECQLKHVPENRRMRIRYEDVCNAPADTLNHFFDFCGLQSAKVVEDFQSLEHHVVGNRMRLGALGQIRLDDSWRKSITLGEQSIAHELAGSMHSRYGYKPMNSSDLSPENT